MLKIKLIIPEKLKRGLANYKEITRRAISTAILKSLITFQREVKKNVVSGWGLGLDAGFWRGALNRSIIFSPETAAAIASGGLKGILGTKLIYARIQEFGGTIVPVKAKMLAWKDPRTKEWSFAHKVTLKPKRYFERGIDTGTKEINGILSQTARVLANELGL